MVVGGQWGRLTMGNYCALGQRGTIVIGQHNRRFASVYPFVLRREPWPGVPDGVNGPRLRATSTSATTSGWATTS